VVHLLALIGILGISFSAVFVRFASVSPVTATFYRTAYAAPVLFGLWLAVRRADRRARRERSLAFASGLLLAIDLDVWHESIALIGAGLGTVLPTVQVVFVAGLAWLVHRERPGRSTLAMVAVVIGGVALTSGLARADAYGANPVAGASLGLLAGLCYATFLLVFRASNRSLAPTAGPLLDCTLGAAAGALLTAPFDPFFSFAPAWPAHGWLVLLALVSQVFGWLLIANALPRLPALETSVMLLVQPVFALVWGRLLFAERPSPLQWTGAAIVVGGVGTLSAIGALARRERAGGVRSAVGAA
jgi:drug/metabolite transporter (DMT)-like permease